MAPGLLAAFTRAACDGAIAQLGERVVRNDEVGGSIPPGSTTPRPSGYAWLPAKPAGRRRTISAELPLLPRKPRRPLLHEARHAFPEIAAVQRDHHFPVGLDGGFAERLKRHLVDLLLDH